MRWLRKKIRSWLGIEDNLQSLIILEQNLSFLEKIIKERTEYHVDVHKYKGAQIIIIGKYGKRDFVSCYSIKDQNLDQLIKHCRYLEKNAHKGKIDSWPKISFCI